MARRFLACQVALLCLLSLTATAQSRYRIQGQVRGTDGEVLPGVTVELRQDGKILQTDIADERGGFSFDIRRLPEARYDIQVSGSGTPTTQRLDFGQRQMEFASAGVRVSVEILAARSRNGGGRSGDDRNHAIVKVYYATDRARISYEPLDYGGDRSPTGRLQLGRFDVSVPRDHQLAKVERPTILTFWREDPNKHFIIVRRIAQTYDQYYGEIASLVGQSQRKEVFVFVHGFNVTFESAIYRTAQMAYDLGFDGAPIVYSWPSEGSMVRYPVDLNNNDWTWPNLRWFLEDIAAKTGAQKVHLIAHSMGNRALVNALNRIVTEQRSTPRPRFSQVVLTAPDIDAAQFIQLAQSLRSGAERVTLYASSNDEALKLSKAYQGYQRAGDSSPDVVVVPGLDTIDVSAIDTNLIGHFYYGDNRSVLTDIFYLLRDARPPGERFGLRPVVQGPRQWWVFKP